jgi:hypothetical protein
MSASHFLAIRGRVHGKQKKPRFTPGPYHVSRWGPRMRSIKAAGGRTVAHVLFSAKRESECEATARLLAAAPDLLLELQLFVSACACGNNSDQVERADVPRPDGTCARCASALTAIAKVEGIE